MSFLNPIALAIGAGLVILPLAVHFLTRPRPVRLPFSTVRFLDSALRQRRFFARLRDVLLLGLRMLLVAALGLAFARPLLQGAAAAKAADVRRRIVLLDCSRSMDARRAGVRAFERAQAVALRELKSKPNVRANIILAAARPRAAFDTFSANWPALHAEVRRAGVRQEELDVGAALARAAELFAESGDARGAELVIVTDLQATNWERAPGVGLPGAVAVRFEHVGLDRRTANLAVTRIAPARRPRAGEPVTVEVDVGNYSDSPQSREVLLTANERPYRTNVECEPRSEARVTFRVPAEAAAADDGWISGNARIVEARDALPADDARHFAFALQEAPLRILITADDPRRVASGSYFLWRMLDPGRPGARAEVKILTPALAASERLGGADLIILNRPGTLSAEAARRLSALLLRGVPIVYVLSQEADAGNLEALKRACRGQLALPVRVGAAASRAEGFGLAVTDPAREPFRSLGDEVDRLARSVRVSAILSTAPDEEAGGDVLATWDDGSAALLTAHAGGGRFVAWNGRIEGSTLPRSAFFVALLRELTLQLILGEDARGDRFPVGEARIVELPDQVETTAQLRLVDRDGASVDGFQLAGRAEGILWRWDPVRPPGVYRVVSDGHTVLTVASGCPAEESDLRRAEVTQLLTGTQEMQGPASARRSVSVRGLPGEVEAGDGVETWPWLIVAGIVAMMAELALLKAFGV